LYAHVNTVQKLPITEKGVKKMIEMIKQFKDALYDPDVFEYFKQCVSKAKKINSNPFAKKAADAAAAAASNPESETAETSTQPSNGS